jgi:hypothetical protein
MSFVSSLSPARLNISCVWRGLAYPSDAIPCESQAWHKESGIMGMTNKTACDVSGAKVAGAMNALVSINDNIQKQTLVVLFRPHLSGHTPLRPCLQEAKVVINASRYSIAPCLVAIAGHIVLWPRASDLKATCRRSDAAHAPHVCNKSIPSPRRPWMLCRRGWGHIRA